MTPSEELSTYLRVLLRHWWMIAISAAIGLAASTIYNVAATPLYAATTRMRVSSAPSGIVDEVWVYNSLATRLMNTYLEYATSDPVLTELVGRLDHETAPTIEAEAVPETELFEVIAWHPDPDAAFQASNIIAEILVDRSLELYRGEASSAQGIIKTELDKAKSDLDQAVAEYEAAYQSCLILPQGQEEDGSSGCVSQSQLEVLSQVVALRQSTYVDLVQRGEDLRVREALLKNAISVMEPAAFPARPARPNIWVNTALGLIFGAAVGILLAFISEGMDTTIHSVDEIEALTSAPVVGQIPEFHKRQMLRNAAGNGRMSSEQTNLEPFHQMWLRLLTSLQSAPKQTIMVTSAEPHAGKSTVAAFLGLALSQGRASVALVDTDFRRPSLQAILQAELWKAGSKIEPLPPPAWMAAFDHLLVNSNLNLFVPSKQATDPTKPIELQKMTSLLATLGKRFTHIVVDSTAMLSVVDPNLLIPNMDVVLLVAAMRRTERSHLRQALLNLATYEGRQTAIVLNRVPRSIIHAYYSRLPKRLPST